ncbi:MAG: hypothetical protein R2851_00265 [Caldilineaceae bacterium]
MVSPRFRIAALIVTLLLAVLLIFVVRLTLNTARPLAATPVPRALATATPAATSTSGTETASLAAPPAIATMTPVSTTVPEPEATVDASPAVELTQVAGGGFAYRAPDGFAVTTGDTSVTLIGPTSSAELAPIFLLSGGRRTSSSPRATPTCPWATSSTALWPSSPNRTTSPWTTGARSRLTTRRASAWTWSRPKTTRPSPDASSWPSPRTTGSS